jgi:hypothetical protein
MTGGLSESKEVEYITEQKGDFSFNFWA